MQPDVSRSSVTGSVMRATNPRTGEQLPDVPVTPVAEIPKLLERARAAQVGWAAMGPHKRAELLQEVQQEFLRSAEELVAAVVAENGKPRGEALVGEIAVNSDLFAFWTQMGIGWLKPEDMPLPEAQLPGKRMQVVRVPRGVVGVISPWNYPVALPLRTLVPALLAGNAVAFKPSEWAPRAGARLFEVFAKVLPEDVVVLIQGDGRQGAAMISGHPDGLDAPPEARGVDFVSFTGSPPSGAAVGQACSRRLIPHSLELGGKDAAIVRADADMDRTIRGILWAALTNAGQNCAAVERVYVDARVHDQFVSRMVEAVKGLRAVDESGAAPADPEVGPITMPAQRAHIHALVTDAAQQGATVHAGGKLPPGPGRYYPPTVLSGVTDQMRIAREETFGPVVAISKVATDEEAVRRTNASAYGLNASVWTRDLATGEALARRLRAGVTLVNNHCFTASLPMAPWSGVGKSGFGSTNGKESLNEFTRPQVVLVDTNDKAPDLWWHPYNKPLEEIALAMVELGRKDGNPQAALGRLQAAAAIRFP